MLDKEMQLILIDKFIGYVELLCKLADEEQKVYWGVCAKYKDKKDGNKVWFAEIDLNYDEIAGTYRGALARKKLLEEQGYKEVKLVRMIIEEEE